jgi:glucokinase
MMQVSIENDGPVTFVLDRDAHPMTRVLAGDIGGTKTILRLADGQGADYQILRENKYVSQDYPHLLPIVQDFLKGLDGDAPQSACFAIAGPVKDNLSQLTNLSWELDASSLSHSLSIPIVNLINDFAAVGYGILHLKPQDLDILQPGIAQTSAPIAILGAGTGLGEALMLWINDQYKVFSTEGGHADFAPRTDLEIGLLKYLRDRHGRVSVERVVSGQGIYAIYEYLRDAQILPESPEVRSRLAQTPTQGAVISEFGLSNQDPLCAQTLDLFVSAYGAEAGNLALNSLSFGGLYLAGGIAAKLGQKMHEPTFLNSFLDKGRLQPLLKDIPIAIILNPRAGLMGAVYYAQKTLNATGSQG